jgi:hypothetical protein
MLTFFVGFSVSDCLGVNTRVEFTTGSVVVSNCLFESLTAAVGGAIYAKGSGQLSVCSTTFLQCNAIGNVLQSAYGGGVCSDGDSLILERCCFRETTSEDWGSALSYKKPSSTAIVSDVSFHFSSGISYASGTIDDQDGAESTFSRLNFTDCRLNPSSGRDAGHGSVILSRHPSADFNFRYCTVLHCIGSTGIQITATATPAIQYCNFYDNAFSDGETTGALFYANAYGMTVTFCVFNNNSAIFFLSGTIVTGYAVAHCVFSQNIAWNSIFTLTSNNYVLTTTASHTIAYTWFTYCPTASPIPTRPVPAAPQAIAYPKDIPDLTAQQSAIIACLEAQAGKTYQLGGEGPDSFDSSGLTKYCFWSVGIELPHSALGQSELGEDVNCTGALPGDLIFYDADAPLEGVVDMVGTFGTTPNSVWQITGDSVDATVRAYLDIFTNSYYSQAGIIQGCKRLWNDQPIRSTAPQSPTQSASPLQSATAVQSATAIQSATAVQSATAIQSPIPTQPATAIQSPIPTRSATAPQSATAVQSATAMQSATAIQSPIPTKSATAPQSATAVQSATAMQSATVIQSPIPTKSATAPQSASAFQSIRASQSAIPTQSIYYYPATTPPPTEKFTSFRRIYAVRRRFRNVLFHLFVR